MSKYRIQEPPYCIQIEMTEGCNLRCGFCGLNGIRGKSNDFKFLSVHAADKIAGMIGEEGWNPRIEFAMHGEPSFNPYRVQIIERFRYCLPDGHIMMTSNGGALLSGDVTENIDSMMEAGLNVLALDDYESVNIVDKLMERYDGDADIWNYPLDKEANPHRRRRASTHDLVIVEDISIADEGVHASLNNHAGCGAPKNSNAQGKRCAKVFRELSIRWNGDVAICCNDWRGEYKVGNVLETPIWTLWQSEEFAAARRKLYHGQRDFGPCAGCDALSYRNGLLPDKFGKEEIPEPDEGDLFIIEQACKGEPLTKPVLREWEV